MRIHVSLLIPSFVQLMSPVPQFRRRSSNHSTLRDKAQRKLTYGEQNISQLFSVFLALPSAAFCVFRAWRIWAERARNCFETKALLIAERFR